jgi:hypothetical protein
MIEWTQKGYSWKGLDRLNTKDHLTYAFSNVGRAIASFHLKYGCFHEETNTFYSVIHGDLHASNIFYDLWSNETTFIDYETMVGSCKIQRNISYDLARLFTFSKKEIRLHVREKAGAEFVKSTGIINFLDEQNLAQKKTYIKERLVILDDFFNALQKGYTHAFIKAGYICAIDNQYNVKKLVL